MSPFFRYFFLSPRHHHQENVKAQVTFILCYLATLIDFQLLISWLEKNTVVCVLWWKHITNIAFWNFLVVALLSKQEMKTHQRRIPL